MRIDVVTIFPEYLAPLDLSLIGRAQQDRLLDVHVHDLRDFTHDRHRTVDDTPYGGGAGMVMKPQPWAEALDHVLAAGPAGRRPRLLVPGPGGVPFRQALAHELAAEPWLAFACGRYEGIDERVYEHASERMAVTVVSLGDYVLNGGEVAVLAITEAVVRLLPGVVGNAESLVEESHEDGLLEYPVYTKPARWADGDVVREVPQVLLSGDHARIAAWRHEQRLERTAARRPDLLHPSQAAGADLAAYEVCVATAADAPELLVLQRACCAHDREVLAETVADVAEGIDAWTTWVFRSGGRLVASVRGRVDPEGATVWQIGRLLVAPDLEGRDLERPLLAHVEAAAPSGMTTFRLTTVATDRGLRLYRKAGYRVRPGEGTASSAVDLTKRRG